MTRAERKRKRMREVVAYFQKYVATYTEQSHYDDYSDKTYLEDMLYGIGLSLAVGTPTDYSGPGGYERFKQALREHLSGQLQQGESHAKRGEHCAGDAATDAAVLRAAEGVPDGGF